jgi:hypothetical protein
MKTLLLRRTVLLASLFLIGIITQAQTSVQISGVIKNSEGQPLPGATVQYLN